MEILKEKTPLVQIQPDQAAEPTQQTPLAELIQQERRVLNIYKNTGKWSPWIGIALGGVAGYLVSRNVDDPIRKFLFCSSATLFGWTTGEMFRQNQIDRALNR